MVSNHQLNLILAGVLLGTTVLAAFSYLIRVLVKGKAHFARVDRDGGSILLGKGLMEMTHWALQPVARGLVILGFSPHTISWLSLVFGLGAAVFLAFGHFGVGALLAAVSAFCDTLDGCVARLMGVASNMGEVLDAAIDRYCEFLYLGALVIYYQGETLVVILCLFACAGAFMVSYATAKAEALGVTPPRGIMRRPERGFYLILGAALSPLTIDLWEAGAARPLGYPMVVAVVMVAVLSNISAVDRLYCIVKDLRMIESNTKEVLQVTDSNQPFNSQMEPV